MLAQQHLFLLHLFIFSNKMYLSRVHWSLPAVGKRAGPGRSAGRSRSGFSRAAGRSAPPPGCPARWCRVGWDCLPPALCPSGPADSARGKYIENTFSGRKYCAFWAGRRVGCSSAAQRWYARMVKRYLLVNIYMQETTDVLAQQLHKGNTIQNVGYLTFIICIYQLHNIRIKSEYRIK